MLGKIKRAFAFLRLKKQIDNVLKQIEKENNMQKLLLSKRFWVSIVGIVATASQVLPPKAAAYAIAAGAIITKVLDIGIFHGD